MAKRRGPIGQLFTGFILLMIVAAGAGVGIAVFYDDDAFASQLRSIGLPEAQISKVMDLKMQVKDKASFHPDDLAFTARSIWWDLRDRFDLDLTDQVSRNLPRVRHVTQMEPMAKPDDPKEPMAEEKTETTLPPDIQREGAETAAAPSDEAKPMEEKPMAEAAAESTMMPAEEKPMIEPAMDETQMAAKPEEQPAVPVAMEEKPMEAAATETPPAPEATGQPVELNTPPAAEPAPEPTPAVQEPAQEPAKEPETAALPPEPAAPAAPAPAPPATAEERLAAADLTYKRALALFADAKSADQKAEAAKLFAQAAIGGHPGAQYSIGVMHYNGTGVAKDYAKAAEWFGRAAEKSNAAAQYNLGILYYNGQGVPKDDRQAYKWISAAAENGDQKAIVARDALKKALPADVTKPEAPTFPSAVPAGEGAPVNITPTNQ